MFRGGGFMQPALVIRNHRGGANDPDTRLSFLDEDMTTRILLAQRDLTVTADKLENRRARIGSHNLTGFLQALNHSLRAAPIASSGAGAGVAGCGALIARGVGGKRLALAQVGC